MSPFKKYYKNVVSALSFRRSPKPSNRHEKATAKPVLNRIKRAIRQPVQARQSENVEPLEESQQMERALPSKEEPKPRKTSQPKEASRLDKASELENARTEARDQIQLSPATAKWYFILADILRQESNLRAALETYKEGIASVPPGDAQQPRLQMEMRSVSATLRRLNIQLSLVPYEIWQLIVEFLDIKDMRQCAGAYGLWCDMLLELPWESFFLSRVRTDKVNEPFVLTIHSGTGCSREITLKEIFMILSHWKSNTFQTLKFTGYRLEYGHDVIKEQRQMFTAIDKPFKFVTFDRTMFYTEEFIPTLESCSRVESISFTEIKLDYSDRYLTRIGNELPWLTFIELSFSNSQLQYWRNQAEVLIDSMAPMFRQCPNLAHFILDNGTPPLQAYCASQALEHCPRLQTLSITIRLRRYVAEMISNRIKAAASTDGTTSSNEPSSATNGLRRFVHRPAIDESGHDFVTSIFNKSFSSLEHIELLYDGDKINTYVISTLASHGAPCLREIYFSLFGHDEAKQTGPPVDQALIDLFSHCPSLEVIRIKLSGEYFISSLTRNAELLMTIAKSCPLLRQLLLRVYSYRFDVKTMLDFADAVGPKLEYLFISMDPSIAHSIVEKITTLVQFSASSYVGEIFNGAIEWADPETMLQTRRAIEHVLDTRSKSSQIDTQIYSRYY